MAFTPYPKHNARFENPCIAVSNDLVHWKSHPKSNNTILDDNSFEKNRKLYNSDTHLLYNSDSQKLECWWRYVDEVHNVITIFRRTSDDGIHWSSKEPMYSSSGKDKVDWISPAIVYDHGIYKIWYVNNKKIWYTEGSGLNNYSTPKEIEIDYGNDLCPWHLDVEKTSNGYELIYVAYHNGAKNHYHMGLYYSISEDGMKFTPSKKVLSERKGNYWDNSGIYRSCLLYIDGVYHIIYTGWDNHENVGLGHVSGTDINELK